MNIALIILGGCVALFVVLRLLSWTGGRNQKKDRELLAVMSKHRTIALEQLSAATGESAVFLNGRLVYLRSHGYIRKTSQAKFSITEKGRQYIKS